MGLNPKALQAFSIQAGCKWQHFECNDTVQRFLACSIHDPHSSSADLFEDLVVSHFLWMGKILRRFAGQPSKRKDSRTSRTSTASPECRFKSS